MDIKRTPNNEFLLWLKNKSQSITKDLASISKLVQQFKYSPTENSQVLHALVVSESHLRDYRNFILWELAKGEDSQKKAPNFRTSEFNLYVSGNPAQRSTAQIYHLKKQ